MKNIGTILTVLFLTISLNLSSQEIVASKPIKTFYKKFGISIESSPTDEKVYFYFNDEKYQHIKVLVQVAFKDKAAMQYFFKKLAEVQYSPKTAKTVDLEVNMDKYVLGGKGATIIRRGRNQWVTYVIVNGAHTRIPKMFLKRMLKKINK